LQTLIREFKNKSKSGMGRRMTLFSRYIGIDYSGAGQPEQGLDGLAVFLGRGLAEPERVLPEGRRWGRRRWNRITLSAWLQQALSNGDGPALVGIDHGFSMPDLYFKRYQLPDWPAMLDDFVQHWPAHQEGVSVESLRRGNRRNGNPRWLRLTECWTGSAKSVFQFNQQGSVGKSTHAGMPWLLQLAAREDVHMWPFDGFQPPACRHMVTEIYPSLFHRRYTTPDNLNDHERDAWSVCRWMRDTDRDGHLPRYLEPPLAEQDRELARREGWILGVA